MNFKRVVWHESFIELLDSIHAHSKSGYHIRCADGVVRHLFPIILILSADYEEQYEHQVACYVQSAMFTLGFYPRCYMALIRGTNSKFPCPVCLVPDTQMRDGSTHQPRTSKAMEQVYNEAAAMPSAEQREEHLKGYGLRNVKVHKPIKLRCTN